MSEEKKKKTKEVPADDGRVIADMNVEGLPWYRKNLRKKKDKNDPDQPTSREIRAMILAAYKAYLPYLLIILGVLTLTCLIGYLILR